MTLLSTFIWKMVLTMALPMTTRCTHTYGWGTSIVLTFVTITMFFTDESLTEHTSPCAGVSNTLNKHWHMQILAKWPTRKRDQFFPLPIHFPGVQHHHTSLLWDPNAFKLFVVLFPFYFASEKQSRPNNQGLTWGVGAWPIRVVRRWYCSRSLRIEYEVKEQRWLRLMYIPTLLVSYWRRPFSFFVNIRFTTSLMENTQIICV